MTTEEFIISFPSKQKRVSDLVNFLQPGSSGAIDYSFFLGSGSSAASGIPTAQQLVKTWRAEVFRSLNPSGDETNTDSVKQWLSENLPGYSFKTEYGELFKHKYSMPKQRRDFIETLTAGKLPSIGYPYLVKLAEKRAFNVVFTSNFDDLLNEAFYQFSSERPLVCAHDSSIAGVSVASRRAKIIKLHGDYLYDNLKNTEEETNKLASNMEDKIREFAKIFGLIVVGYSGGDRSIMRILHDLVDSPMYFQNGLYWCARPGHIIAEEVVELLKKEGCFLVVIDGFDELMADLYVGVCGRSLPFRARSGSDFAAQIVRSYGADEGLASSPNVAIREHVAMIKEEQSGSLVAEALQKLHKERGEETSIKDADFVKYVELERLFRCRDYNHAFKQIREAIDSCDSVSFKKVLAARLFHAAKALYDTEEAKRAIQTLRGLEPANYFLSLPLSELTDNPEERIEILRNGLAEAPYEEIVHHRYAASLETLFHSVEPRLRPTAEEVVLAYKKAIELSPAINNPSWASLFDFLNSPFAGIKDKEQTLKWIVDEHLKQDAYAAESIRILVAWCKLNRTENFDDQPAIKVVLSAFHNHFPRNYAGHLSIIRDFSIDSGNFSVLSEAIPICEAEPDIDRNSSYVGVKMDIVYRVCRDLQGAIRIGRDFVAKRPSVRIEKKLFRYYLDNGELGLAQEQLDRLTGAIDFDEHLGLRIDLEDHNGDVNNAIDLLMTAGRKRGEDANYVVLLSFLQLRLKDYRAAHKTTKEFFEKNNYSLRYEEAMINYEYSKIKLGRNASKKHLERLAESSNSHTVRSVSLLLLGDRNEALEVIKSRIQNDFSILASAQRWPVFEALADEIGKMREGLVATRRLFPGGNGGPLRAESMVVDV